MIDQGAIQALLGEKEFMIFRLTQNNTLQQQRIAFLEKQVADLTPKPAVEPPV